jgi:hypothetical protein
MFGEDIRRIVAMLAAASLYSGGHIYFRVRFQRRKYPPIPHPRIAVNVRKVADSDDFAGRWMHVPLIFRRIFALSRMEAVVIIPRIVAAAALLAFTLTGHAGSIQFGSVKTQGLPEIRIGDDVEAVQKALNTSMQPDEMESSIPATPFAPKKTELRLKTRGIWIFFSKGKVTTIRLDPPFSGNIGGIKLGDSAGKIEKVLGAPIKRSAWGLLTGYTYYLDDVTTARLMVNRDDELETVFLEK